MNLNNYTIRAQEAVQAAVQIAEEHQQLGIEPGHLLQAILRADEQNISFLLHKLNVSQQHILAKLMLPEAYGHFTILVSMVTNGIVFFGTHAIRHQGFMRAISRSQGKEIY